MRNQIEARPPFAAPHMREQAGIVSAASTEASTTAAAIREAVANLTANLPMRERQLRFLELFNRVVGCESSVLLRYQDSQLTQVATCGLSGQQQARAFSFKHHPHFAAIVRSRAPVRFSRPGPGAGPLATERSVRHGGPGTAVGCALYNEDMLFGVLYAASSALDAFDAVEDEIVQTFAAIATVMLRHETYITTLENLARHRGLVATELVQEALQRSYPLVGDSPATKALMREIEIVARSDLSVLLSGETGVGKEVVARIIHSRSSRADQPLVYVNCAALPEALAESELFGHVRGAFSGASADRAGKFELANGGTLLLDEIGELPLAVQAKLLRAVQFGEIQRLGSDRSHRADVRIIASTNRRLDDEVAAGRFRADLFHRLSMFPLHVPPLRERDGDVEILAQHFLEQARVRLRLSRVALARATIGRLAAYGWPGNLRELEHVILRAALRASAQRGDVLTLEPTDLDLPDAAVVSPAAEPPPNAVSANSSLQQSVDEFQRGAIQSALTESGGNWSEAARRLEIDRANLHRLAKRLGLK